jgi:serine phosphatase RsbU (regulator of sigma subunit)
LLFIAIMAAIFTTGIRNKGREGWLALPAVVLMASTQFSRELDLLHFPIPLRWFLLGVMIIRNVMAYLALAAIMYVLLLRRLRISLRRQRDLALDVKQAQEVQQVILPEARLVLPGLKGLPGLTIESEYRPAREVGGDFFQIIPHKSDGSVLIVAGDVTGKGLQAGMLVALLVGAIRSTAELNSDPAFVLSALNRRLMGRNDAQATCLALRIEADGAATLANAGHVAPYLNGEELPMEGALPLGMVDSAEPSVMHFQLAESDRLTLMSDGIAEAMDANGQLFGFERVHELLHTATSATEIAGAAQAFGQEDDISVISVTRIAVREPVAV